MQLYKQTNFQNLSLAGGVENYLLHAYINEHTLQYQKQKCVYTHPLTHASKEIQMLVIVVKTFASNCQHYLKDTNLYCKSDR